MENKNNNSNDDTIYICIDESGNLHKNSSNRFFVIGGFITNNSLKGRSIFKNEILKYKISEGILPKDEVKGSTVPNSKKKIIMENIKTNYQKSNIFEECLIVVDKKNLKKEIEEVNILYNYFLNVLIKRLNSKGKLTNKKIVIKLDNRTIKVGSVNGLYEYLKGEYFFSDVNISEVIYEDSKHREEIQLADFICNYYWRVFEKTTTFKIKENDSLNICYFPYSDFGK